MYRQAVVIRKYRKNRRITMAKPAIKTKGKAGDFERILGRLLKNMRASLNYNQEDVAKEIGVTFQQIQKYEGGTNRIPLFNFLKICSFFGVSPEDLINKVEGESKVISFGFAEDGQESLENDLFSRPETGVLLREFYKIHDPEKRKQALAIIKTFQSAE